MGLWDLLHIFQSGVDVDPKSPDRHDRKKCWDGRDAYFACLDALQVTKPEDEGDACAGTKIAYERSCAKSWIQYFNQRRVIGIAQKDRLARAAGQNVLGK